MNQRIQALATRITKLESADRPVTEKDVREFTEWARTGVKNYPNFPVGRTDKLSNSMVVQFLMENRGMTESEAESGKNRLPWKDAIREHWSTL